MILIKGVNIATPISSKKLPITITIIKKNSFIFSPLEKIYANIIAGTNLQTRQVVSFAPDDQDEKITDVIHYQQAWFGTNNYYDYEFVLDSHQTQILVVTYNETTGEGKIYAKPFNVNSGLFSMTDQGETYDGFGEITAIAPVPR